MVQQRRARDISARDPVHIAGGREPLALTGTWTVRTGTTMSTRRSGTAIKNGSGRTGEVGS